MAKLVVSYHTIYDLGEYGMTTLLETKGFDLKNKITTYNNEFKREIVYEQDENK